MLTYTELEARGSGKPLPLSPGGGLNFDHFGRRWGKTTVCPLTTGNHFPNEEFDSESTDAGNPRAMLAFSVKSSEVSPWLYWCVFLRWGGRGKERLEQQMDLLPRPNFKIQG